MHSNPKIRSHKEGGFVLIASLLMLIVMTLLAVSLYHNFTVQENVASNTKEKGRAFQLAQSTLQYAEYVLVKNSAALPATTACAGKLSTLTICSNAYSITAPTSAGAAMTLSSYAPYTSMQPAIAISTTGGSNTYYGNPQYYLQFLGAAPGGVGQIYQVTALSYGSTASAVSVVQSTYELSSGTKCLSCGP
ncbi:pilus assembly PilX family protein [Dyella lipolytica]|uniref:Type 4 fimbrial biogenesis protein PilX N-terminal domain-containing protein n=1 Tax=Dyella lipolytica TaxID=1867835 RepID=A0ABW8ISI5_9GAMM|nr:PilX N-terminal domain-containing pilus assembly protein [Dyella lipolytica]